MVLRFRIKSKFLTFLTLIMMIMITLSDLTYVPHYINVVYQNSKIGV